MAFQIFLRLLPLVLAGTPTWYPEGSGPETYEQRTARWAMVAGVIAQEAAGEDVPFRPVDAAALVYVTWQFESALDYHVHAGERSPLGTQDRGYSRCLGQIQHTRAWWSEQEWLALAGTDLEATRRCARATLRVFTYHAKRCELRLKKPAKSRWKAPMKRLEAYVLISAYAQGNACRIMTGKNGLSRIKEWRRVRGLLEP